MKFYGQKNLLTELNIIIASILKGDNLNLLFRAPSGYGKTTLGLKLYTYFNDSAEYILPKDGEFSLDLGKRFHFIDEAHLIKDPEWLYPLMDSQKYVFLFASNESGTLKEPLINRCIPFIFSDYTEEEMWEMVHIILEANGFSLSKEMEEIIVGNTQNNPRIAKQICQRLIMVFRNYSRPKSVEELKDILKNILQIEDGFNVYHARYLNFLKTVGTSSLDNISLSTRIDKETIKRDVEPYLLFKNLIRISSRGRSLNI